MENDKVIISIQLPKEVHEKLKIIANEECSSVSYIIRKAILTEIRKMEEKF